MEYFREGLMLLLVTPETLAVPLDRMQYHKHYSRYLVPGILVGLYLTYTSFAASSPRSILR